MKRIIFVALICAAMVSSVFVATPAFASESEIRVDEAVIETNSDKGSMLVIRGDFPVGVPLEVTLQSGGFTKAIFRKFSNDGLRIEIPLKDIPDASDTTMRVFVNHVGGMPDN